MKKLAGKKLSFLIQVQNVQIRVIRLRPLDKLLCIRMHVSHMQSEPRFGICADSMQESFGRDHQKVLHRTFGSYVSNQVFSFPMRIAPRCKFEASTKSESINLLVLRRAQGFILNVPLSGTQFRNAQPSVSLWLSITHSRKNENMLIIFHTVWYSIMFFVYC